MAMWLYQANIQEEEQEEFYDYEYEEEEPEEKRPRKKRRKKRKERQKFNYIEPEEEFLGYYQEEDEEESRPRIGLSILIFVLLLYIAFVSVGTLTTDYANGRGYIVSKELREERAYIKEITPYYEVLIKTPELIEELEKSTSNTIDLQFKLGQLRQTLYNLLENTKKEKPPLLYQPYLNFLNTLTDKELSFLQEKIVYHQDKKEDRIPEMKAQKQEILYLIDQAKAQMDSIQERLHSNLPLREDP